MASISGSVRFTGFIAPTDSTDTYPVFKPIYGLGGMRTVDTVADRDAITTGRREEGMLVYVKSDLNYYQLASGLTNSDWFNLNLTNGTGSTAASITQFNVTASGTNAYSGVSTPTITGYSTADLYLTQFDNENTITGVTLDINGYGPLDIVKGTTSGLTPLDISDIQTGVTYYLTYDGAQFQFFSSTPYPAQTPGTYTNLNPATATIGGVAAGTTFSAVTWQSVFDSMFYPTLVPAFSSFAIAAQSQTLEVGNSVCGGTRTFTWATTNSAFVNPNSIVIRNTSAGNVIISTPSSGMTNDGTQAITGLTNTKKTVPTSHTWTIFATRTNNMSINRTFPVTWYWRRMQGVSSATTMSSSTQINAFSGTGTLTNTMVGTYTLNGAGYKYFFMPSGITGPTLFKDNSTQLAVAMADVTDNSAFSGTSGIYSFAITNVTNSFGITTPYRVYRTRNLLNGNIIITIT